MTQVRIVGVKEVEGLKVNIYRLPLLLITLL